MRIKIETLVIIGLAILLLSYMGYDFLNLSSLQKPDKEDVIPTTHESAAIQLEVINSVLKSGVTTATTTVDVFNAVNGVFDFLSQGDTKTQAANPQAMNTMWQEGSELIIRVGCTGNPTGGTAYYDGWYYVVLYEGNRVYAIDANDLAQVSGSPHYTYTMASNGRALGQEVTWTSGTTNYWNIGKLPIYPRTDANTLDLFLQYNGADLASIADGSTYVDTDAEITANATLTSTDESLFLSWYADANDLGYGGHNLVVGQSGKIMEYKAYLIMSTAMTAIGTTKLENNGWGKIEDSTLYAEKAFYTEFEPTFPTKGAKGRRTIEIPIDASGAATSTEFLFSFWLIDVTYEEDLRIGSTTTTCPTAYGGVTAYGVAAKIYATAYSTSSGAGTGEVLCVYVTTAA